MNIKFKIATKNDSLYNLIKLLEDCKNDSKSQAIAYSMDFSLKDFYSLSVENEKLNFLSFYYDKKIKTQQKNINNFLIRLNNMVKKNIFDIENKFKNIFGEVVKDIEVTGLLWPSMICPYNLKTNEFMVHYYDGVKKEKCMQTVLHEITHIFWWKYIDKLFKNEPENQKRHAPNISWLISELVVDSILNENDFKKYLETEYVAYKKFYKIEINNVNVMEHLRNLYKDNKFDNFIKKTYDYVKNNENIFALYMYNEPKTHTYKTNNNEITNIL